MIINDAILNEAATQFKEELLLLPAVTVENEAADAVLVETGVTSKLVLGALFTDPDFAPKKANAVFKDNGVSVGARTLTTNIGQAILREDRASVQRLANRIARNYQSSNTANDYPLQMLVLNSMAREVGRKIYQEALFKGEYDANGTTTDTVMNGFDKIVADDITATNISLANKNLYAAGMLTVANVGDMLEDFYTSRVTELKNADAVLCMPHAIWEMYNRWVLDNFGAVAYNDQYRKGVLHCAPNVTLKALAAMDTSPYLYFTRKNNLVFGVDETSPEASIEVRRDNDPNKWQFVYTMAVGGQIESIHNRLFSVATFTLGS